MAHPQHNFTSNFNGSTGHNAELTLNINGVEKKYTPAGNDQTYNVPGVVRIDIDLASDELIQAIRTALDGAAQPMLVEMSIYDEETVFQYIGELDDNWCFGIATTELITTISISKEDGTITYDQITVGNGTVLIQAEAPDVYIQLLATMANGQLPVLHKLGTSRDFYYWPTAKFGIGGDYSFIGYDGQHLEIATVQNDNNVTYTTIEVPTVSTASPSMDGIASAGSSVQWSRGDHVHPTDTSREAAANKTTTVRQNGQADNTRFPTEAAVRTAIDSAVSSAYHAAGTKTVAQLTSSLLVSANEGDVYNITDSGTTTSDFIEGTGHPIRVGDNVVVCGIGGGVYKFDLLSGFVDLTNYLTKTGDGSDVTTSFTAASTRTNVTTGEKLSALFGKVAKWFGDLKALAFKDKVSTSDLDDDAVTADKVMDHETLPVNITGYASHLRQAKCRFFNTETGYRLMAHLPPKSGYSDTLYTFNIYENRDANILESGILKGVLSIHIRNNNGTYQYSGSYKGSSFSNIGFEVRVDSSTHGVFVYAAKNNQYYANAVFELLNAFDGYGNDIQYVILYADSVLQNSVSGDSVPIVFTLLKQSGGTIPLANNSGVGSVLVPVYVSSNGEVLKCENRIHDLTLQIKYIKISGQMTGRKILCDRQSWTGTAANPDFATVDPYELAVWINRGDVIQVDFTTYDWWGDKFPGLIVEAQCDVLAGDTRVICTNLRVLRQKIVNQQPTIDFQWSDLITDEDTNTRYMEFQGV